MSVKVQVWGSFAINICRYMPVMSFVLGCNDFFKKYKSVELGNQLANICNAKIHMLFHCRTFWSIWISTGVRKGIQISNASQPASQPVLSNVIKVCRSNSDTSLIFSVISCVLCEMEEFKYVNIKLDKMRTSQLSLQIMLSNYEI